MYFVLPNRKFVTQHYMVHSTWAQSEDASEYSAKAICHAKELIWTSKDDDPNRSNGLWKKNVHHTKLPAILLLNIQKPSDIMLWITTSLQKRTKQPKIRSPCRVSWITALDCIECHNFHLIGHYSLDNAIQDTNSKRSLQETSASWVLMGISKDRHLPKTPSEKIAY